MAARPVACLPQAAPAAHPAPAERPTNLPAQPTPLIGRSWEVAAIRARLLEDDVRLLTLTGPPGTGKTRLAHAVAARLAPRFEDGAWFVPLEVVRDPAQVLPAVAAVLGAQESGGRSIEESLVARLADRSLLLLLDNFEQVLPAGADVAGLLSRCPALTVLVTSRAPLRVRWEQEVPLAPLALPRPHADEPLAAVAASPAVQLFVARARAVTPAFTLTAENAAAVAAICRALDGLPLAIELAAARIRLLTPEALLRRLERRLDVLTGGPRDLPDRHRSLAAALLSSFELLDAGEQRLLRRLAVFIGGCTLDAVEQVAADGDDAEAEPRASLLDLLESLVAHSLVQRAEQAGGPPRVRLLETVREFALEQLAAAGDLAPSAFRHAGYYLSLAEAAAADLTGPGQSEALARLDADHENLRAALACLLDRGDASPALRLATALARFWDLRGHLSEGRRWLERALSAAPAAPLGERALALQAAARLAWSQADLAAARRFTEDSLALLYELDDRLQVAVALNTLGTIAVRNGDYATGRGHFTEALAVVRGLGDRGRTSVALTNLGTIALEQGEYAAARSHFEESLALARALGDDARTAFALDLLGQLAHALGDHARARALSEEALGIRRALGDPRAVAYSLCNVAAAMRAQGDPATARALIEESLSLRRDIGDRLGVALSQLSLGGVLRDEGAAAAARAVLDESLATAHQLDFRQGVCGALVNLALLDVVDNQPSRAARLLGAAQALRETSGIVMPPVERAEHDAAVTTLRGLLGEEAFAAVWSAGRGLTPAQAVAASSAPVKPEGAVAGSEAVHEPASLPPRPPAVSLPGGLTAREAEVLRLLAAGHSNPEIAAALVLSVHTVERHTVNIYAKIGARGRPDAIAFAHRHGLA